MARQKRLNIPGAIYHVITRGHNRVAIFKSHHDRREFIRRLECVLTKTGCRCYAWALMPNHIHLLLRISDYSLSGFMRKLLTGYAIYFNHRYDRIGYLFQNRFKSILCQEEMYFLELVRYLHLNPVRASILKTMSELDSYAWTGHSTLIGKRHNSWQITDEVLSRFGKGKEAITGYRQFLEDGWQMGKRDDLCGGGLKRSAGGWNGVLELKRNHEYWRGEEQVLGDGEFVNQILNRAEELMAKAEKYKRKGWTLERLAATICNMMHISQSELKLKGRKNKISYAKGLIAYWGCREFGFSGAAIARYLEISAPAVHKNFQIGEKLVVEGNIKLIS
jgi:putative transposase